MADRYGGVSIQTRAAIDKLARDVGGDMSDMAVGANQTPIPTGTPAVQSVRGQQTAAQQEQLTRLLMNRGMSREQALAEALRKR